MNIGIPISGGNGVAPKVTSAAEIQLLFKERSFSSSSLYLSIIQLLLCKELFHQSRFHLAKKLFNLSSFYLSNFLAKLDDENERCLNRTWDDEIVLCKVRVEAG